MSENEFWVKLWAIAGVVASTAIICGYTATVFYYVYGYQSCVVGSAILMYCK